MVINVDIIHVINENNHIPQTENSAEKNMAIAALAIFTETEGVTFLVRGVDSLFMFVIFR